MTPHCMWRDSSVGRVLNSDDIIASLQGHKFDSKEVLHVFFFLSRVRDRGMKLYSLKALAYQLPEKPQFKLLH